MDTTNYLTVADAAALLGIDPAGVRRYLRMGRLDGRRITPRFWLVSAKSVRTFVRFPPGPRPKT